MSLSLEQKRILQIPSVAFSILTHPLRQEIETVWQNEVVWFIQEEGRIATYCVLKDRGQYNQLMDVFTFPAFRRRGYGTNLLNQVLHRSTKPNYLICREELDAFYQKADFHVSESAPEYMQRRLRKINVGIGRIIGKHIIMHSK